MKQSGKVLWGIDLGGTKVEVVVCSVNEDGMTPVVRRRASTERDKGYQAILDNIGALIDSVVLEVGERAACIGVGTPGVLDPRTGLLKNSNTLCLNGMPLERDLAGRLGVPVVLANDANCFALAEALYGGGKGGSLVFGVILGTGVGGGLVIDGRVRYGLQGIAGEWGHNVLDSSGLACYCGKRGCVETWLSGPALESHFHQLSGERVSLAEIAQRAVHGDRQALELRAHAREYFRRAIAVIINVMDPDRIVLGGGVSNLDWFYDKELFAESHDVFNDDVQSPIVKNTLGDSAGVFGAALLVVSH